MIQQPSRIPRYQDPEVISYFLGMDITNTDDIRRSPLMVNCILDDESTPEMRPGYVEMFNLGSGPILGVHQWSDNLFIVHHGKNLYTWTGSGTPLLLAANVMDGTSTSVSFKLSGRLCIKDSSAFKLYNSSGLVDVLDQAYTPLFLISTPPTGGGTRNEDLNLLNPARRQSFNTEDGVLEYQLAGEDFDSIDAVELNGSAVDYTADLSTGVITLAANPGAYSNGLEVTASRAADVDPDLILKCKIHGVYGGQSDSRVFLTGNPDYPHLDWWSALNEDGGYDITYWPDTNSDSVGGDNSPIMGYAVQYDRMVVIKSDYIYLRSWELTTDAYNRPVTRFPSTILNSNTKGAHTSESIALIDNTPWFLSDRGMVELQGTQVRDERNIWDISSLVDIPASGKGVAIDFDHKYYLAVDDDEVWVADYRRGVKDNASGKNQPVWYKWDSMPVNVWFQTTDTLYFGSNVDGRLYRMMDRDTDDDPYNDNGEAINARWEMHFSTFGRDDMTKLIHAILIRQKKWSRGEIDVSYASESAASVDITAHRVVLFDFLDMDFSDFSFDTSRMPKAFSIRVDDVRDVQTFRIILTSSGVPNEFMGFSSVTIRYQYLREV